MAASKEKEARMWALADKLADSGEYSEYCFVESELIAQGYSRARQLFQPEQVRARINKMCSDARARQKSN